MPTSELTVFIVDDDEGICRAMTRSLTLRGYNVSAFTSAEAFLGAYQVDQSGCLVLDMWMPGMSGLELQKQLQQRQINLPIIFISGHGEPPVPGNIAEQGNMDILEKPYPVDLLMERIDKALASHH